MFQFEALWQIVGNLAQQGAIRNADPVKRNVSQRFVPYPSHHPEEGFNEIVTQSSLLHFEPY
jgi:hypothetical protein